MNLLQSSKSTLFGGWRGQQKQSQPLQRTASGRNPALAAPHATLATSATAAPEVQEPQDTRPTAAALRSALTTEICPEHIEDVELQVKGEVPAWLSGVLLRNGPGTFRGKRHLFDGYAMIVKFSIQDGHVRVSNRFVESNAWKAFRDSGEPKFGEFGTPLPSLWKSVKNILVQATGLGQGFTDNSNVNVLPHPDGRTAFSLTESAAGTFRLDLSTLATLGALRFRDDIKGALTTAHPSVMADGSLINLTSDFGGKYMLFRTQLGSDIREKIAEIPLRSGPSPSWIHDFPCTANYAIIPETPVYFNVKALSVGGDTEYVVMDWKPEQQTQLTVVPLNGDASGIKRFNMPTYFTFHYVNAFESEDGSELSFDFGWQDHPGMLNNLLLEEMRSGERSIIPGPLRRVTLPLHGGSEVRITNLMKDDSEYIQVELPRVNPAYKGKPYRYAYSVSAKPPCVSDNALAKYDLEDGETKTWFESGALPSEPLMVPRPGAAAEDDGAVLSVVTGADGLSYLLILDASTFQEVARAQLDFGIPYQFHGNWFSTA